MHNLNKITWPEFHSAWLQVLQSPWNWLEVSMQSDLQDWNEFLAEERIAIASILRGFSLIEQRIGCYWRDIICSRFEHKHEVVAMATTFAHQEQIHAQAYAYLESSLGLDTYEAFLQDEAAVQKLNYYITNSDNAKSIAIFSGCAEGVSLFGSFAVLLSFAKKGKLKGMTQILSWSVADETLHSRMGIELFKKLIKSGSQKPSQNDIKLAFDMAIQNEFEVLEQIFAYGNLPTISLAETKAFVLHRANNRLQALGYKELYSADEALVESVSAWFYPLVRGGLHNDFFALARNGAGYSASLNQDFVNVDYRSLMKA